ncbi:MAG TPA: ATP synthase F0 subunit B [Ignavibacteriaceae bacterium]|nr:ATP synthase F0 subunit B [Ignavibacteriaceae bacterium]
MEIKKTYRFFTPVLLGVLMFSSNFMNTNLFNYGENNFAVWFILSLFCFACGWFIDRTLNWITGGKVIFATIVAATFISVLVITFFKDYFEFNTMLSENIILYSLRNITLGAMGYFGMAVAEILHLEKDYASVKEKLKMYEEGIQDSKKQAENIIKEAQINAQKILNDAIADAQNIFLKKERIEEELKNFIEVEKELIKKYEDI